MAKLTVYREVYDKELSAFVEQDVIYEGDYDASVNKEGIMVILTKTELSKPDVVAIYNEGSWSRVEVDND